MDTTLPPDVESAVLADYLDPAISLFELAERHGLDLRTLIEWADSAATHHLLHRLKRVVDSRAVIIASHHAPAAMTALAASGATSLATAAETEDEARRFRGAESARMAASHILRIAAGGRKARTSETLVCSSGPCDGGPAEHPASHAPEPSQGLKPDLPETGLIEAGNSSSRPDLIDAGHGRTPPNRTARGDPRGRSRSARLTGCEVS